VTSAPPSPPGVDSALLPVIDWQQPWFAPYRELGRPVAARVAQGVSVAQALNAQRGALAPRFVGPQAHGSEAYEAFVARTSCVPTRDNAHDFFNGLVWLRFAALKRWLNRLHAQELARHGVAPVRGAVRDALTLFDESGALFSAAPVLLEALRQRRWTDLCVAQRGLWDQARLTLVGHALLEKLVQPRKAITGHVWFTEPGSLEDASGSWAGFNPAVRADAPLPVLGVPGWWPANQVPGFYADAAVFRPGDVDAAVVRPAGSLRSTDSARPCRS